MEKTLQDILEEHKFQTKEQLEKLLIKATFKVVSNSNGHDYPIGRVCLIKQINRFDDLLHIASEFGSGYFTFSSASFIIETEGRGHYGNYIRTCDMVILSTPYQLEESEEHLLKRRQTIVDKYQNELKKIDYKLEQLGYVDIDVE